MCRGNLDCASHKARVFAKSRERFEKQNLYDIGGDAPYIYVSIYVKSILVKITKRRFCESVESFVENYVD